jgi:addiction module HigA family antidote
MLEINTMTQRELAVRLSCTPKHVNEVIKGQKPISNALAVKLENVFSLKASFWNKLQNNYNEN